MLSYDVSAASAAKKKLTNIHAIILFILMCPVTCSWIDEGRIAVKCQKGAGMVVDDAGNVTKNMTNLLSLLSVAHDGSLQDIVNKTQKLWLRGKGKELWDVADMHAAKRADIWPILEKVGCVREVTPSKKEYDYLLLLGAMALRVRYRLAFAKKLWNQGVRFKKIVLLSGSRKLNAELEKKDTLLNTSNEILPLRNDWQFDGNLPQTEVDMMKMVYDQSDLPSEMRDVPLIVINAPEHIYADGTIGRPTTDDTINQWLKSSPEGGSCLAISNQPYIGRQHASLKSLLPENFSVESVGDGIVSRSNNISVLLDTLARWLYQELEYSKKRKLRDVVKSS